MRSTLPHPAASGKPLERSTTYAASWACSEAAGSSARADGRLSSTAPAVDPLGTLLAQPCQVFSLMGVFLLPMEAHAIRPAMEERSGSETSTLHTISEESGSRAIALGRLHESNDARREAETSTAYGAIKSPRLFENVLRALATPQDGSPIKAHAALKPVKSLREVSTIGDPSIESERPIERLDGVRAAVTSTEDSPIKSHRVFESVKPLRDAIASRGDSSFNASRIIERLEALGVGRASSEPSKNEHAVIDHPGLREPDASKNSASIKLPRLVGHLDVLTDSSRLPRQSPALSQQTSEPVGERDLSVGSNKLLEQLDDLADELAAAAPEDAEALQLLHPSRRLSGCNLLQYLALRRHEIRPLQAQLAEQGLASLGLSEAHLAASLHAVRAVLHRALGKAAPAMRGAAPSISQGTELLAQATSRLLGQQPEGRRARIMVTMAGEEANDGALIKSLLQSGMNCMRINCAHDGPDEWLAMVQQLRTAEKQLGQSCKVLMDMSGPKPRTGPLELGPPMLKWRPAKNQFGHIVRPAIVALAPSDSAVSEEIYADALLRLPAEFLERLRPREELKLKDARGVPRRLIVRAKHGNVWFAEGHSTSYVTDGTVLRSKRSESRAIIRGLPRAEEPLLLEAGDALRLTKSLKPGRHPIRDCSGRVVQPATIGCTLGEAFCQLRAGQRVLIDDGKIECVIRSADADGALLDIVRVLAGGAKLRSDRGVNFPDSRLRLPALMAKDFRDLSFIVQHADMVGFSFVQRPDDVFYLQEHLSRLGKPEIGIVLKVETRRAFENLPALLWAAMRSESVGVMIARGDLAVECGYERLAEMQEEILRLCEAAHLPVIWATQVLERLAKSGVPSRAEITDAAVSERAECVMLNKGPHIDKAMLSLDRILSTMHSHKSTRATAPQQLQVWGSPPWP
jgi:pyruvate kinase